jgi:hypothetical protein
MNPYGFKSMKKEIVYKQGYIHKYPMFKNFNILCMCCALRKAEPKSLHSLNVDCA